MTDKSAAAVRELTEKIKKIHNKYATPCKFGITSSDFDLVSQEIELLVNQEVEKRIAERMPSEDDGRDHIPYPDKPTELKHYQNIGFIRGWRAAITECRSRLTPQVVPQDTPQEQRTEGGE